MVNSMGGTIKLVRKTVAGLADEKLRAAKITNMEITKPKALNPSGNQMAVDRLGTPSGTNAASPS